MKVLANPHLPSGEVRVVAMSGKYPKLVEQVAALGIEVVKVPPSADLDEPVQSHADMLFFHAGGERLILARGLSELKPQLVRLGFTVIDAERNLERKYPKDVGLNLLSLGEFLFGNSTAVDPAVLKNQTEKRLIPVRQGYAKCSCCVVDESHVITSDSGIARSLEAEGIDVLQVTTEGIFLEGYSCGLIGGCCGKIAPDKLLFTGSFTSYPDGDAIREFAARCGVSVLCLPNQELIDIGSILPLTEK